MYIWFSTIDKDEGGLPTWWDYNECQREDGDENGSYQRRLTALLLNVDSEPWWGLGVPTFTKS
jgi:hypothetical protein